MSGAGAPGVLKKKVKNTLRQIKKDKRKTAQAENK